MAQFPFPLLLAVVLVIVSLCAISTLAQAVVKSTPTTTSTPSSVRSANAPLIGPLTTIFTPPASCLTSEAITTGNVTSLVSESIFNNGPSGAPGIRKECFPSIYPHDDAYYYSPGICPSGWVLNTLPAVQQLLEPPLAPGETGGICCPPRYAYRTEGPQACSSYLNKPTSAYLLNASYFVYFEFVTMQTVIRTLTTLATTITLTADSATTLTTGISAASTQIGSLTVNGTLPYAVLDGGATVQLSQYFGPLSPSPAITPMIFTQASQSTISLTSNVGPGTVYASGIQVRWRPSDNLPINSPSYHSPVSSRAKAGIGVGVTLIVLIILGLVSWIHLRRRASRRRPAYTPNAATEPFPTRGEKGELPASPVKPATPTTQSVDHTAGWNELDSPRAQDAVVVGPGAAEMQSTSGGGGPAALRSASDATEEASELAEVTSIRPHAAIRRKPVQPIPSPPLPSPIPRPWPTPASETNTPTAASAAPGGPRDAPSLAESRLAREGEQASSIGIPSTAEDSSLLWQGENPSTNEEEEWLRAELARVRERKEHVREIQRLKDEEQRLAAEEVALRERMRAKAGGAGKATGEHGLV